MMGRRQGLGWVIGVAIAASIALSWASNSRPGQATAPAPEDNTAATGASGDLADLKVVEERSDVDGYERDCGKGKACVFGPAWSDDVNVEFGHDGCDTRNNILKTQLTAVEIKPGTNECVVAAGVLDDPYTGQQISFARGEGNTVSVDHIVPLKAAWDHGAHAWSAEQRRDFANDPRNLQATDWGVNSSKGDQTPGQWLPMNQIGACEYGRRYIEVSVAYELTISQGDLDSLLLLEGACDAGPTMEGSK